MKVLVTGGGGFLGSAICRKLAARGDSVVAFGRNDYPELVSIGVTCLRGDIQNGDDLQSAVNGCDALIHVAAKAGVWGRYDEYFGINVLGTRNVIEACRAAGIGKLVYTSSPSATFGGKDQEGVDESEPYPERYLASYPQTKAQAEQEILRANGSDLATVALRPHLIWGPGDPHLVPRILERAKLGKLAMIGDGSNLVDSVYVDNAADAHIQALDHLDVDSACAGKAYFISNDEPLSIRDLINRILKAGGLEPVKKQVSPSTAYAVGAFLEAIHRIFRISREPIMTRFVARQLSTHHYFDLSAAKSDFGYAPQVTLDEGFERLTEWLESKGG